MKSSVTLEAITRSLETVINQPEASNI